MDLVLTVGAVPLTAHGKPQEGDKELRTMRTARRGAQGAAEGLFDGKKMLGVFGTHRIQSTPGPQ